MHKMHKIWPFVDLKRLPLATTGRCFSHCLSALFGGTVTVNMCLDKTVTMNKLSCMPPGSSPACQEKTRNFCLKRELLFPLSLSF